MPKKKQFLSPDPRHFDKQTRMNAAIPTPSGVISSPDPKNQDSIQPVFKPMAFASQARQRINESDDEDSEGEVHSMENDNAKAMREEPGQAVILNVRGVARVSNYRKAK